MLVLAPILLALFFPSGSSAELRVVGGKDASIKDWPFVVSLALRTDHKDKPVRSAYWGHFCTGTLLTRTIVLTARHCQIGQSKPNTDVIVGRSNLSQVNRGERIATLWHEVVNNYDADGDGGDDYGGDLGLLRLAKPAQEGQPLGLARLGSPNKDPARIAGWGYTRETRPEVLQAATLPRVSDDYCALEYPRHRWDWGYAFVRGANVCAGYPQAGASSCMGDSGGPLMQGGKLVGVTSWGPNYCGDGGSGVYVRVDRWKRWINKTVRWYGRKFWKKEKKRPIKEKAGWSSPRRISWSIRDAQTLCNGLPRCYKAQHTVVLRSNRPIRGATISIPTSSILCPGDHSEYPNRYPNPDDRDERCAQEFPMKATPGGEEVAWEGWSSDSNQVCPRITLQAQIGGQPYRKSYYSCEVEELAKG